MGYRLLMINMGSTSTKLGVYEDTNFVWQETLSHPREVISQYLKFMDQYDYRMSAILDVLKEKGEELSTFAAFVSRGGTVQPVPGGTYRITEKMLEDSQSGKFGDHPCNIGGQIAYDLGEKYGKPAFTVDPPVCNEMWEEATYSGLPEIQRIASFQQLNHRAIAKKYCSEQGVNYDEQNLIVAHMGGGVSVAAHCQGKIRDVNNALAGDGPFALERSGGLPVGSLINLCYSNQYTQEEMLRRVNGRGGMVAYIGLVDGREIGKRIDAGDKEAEMATRAMAYQIAKEIGALSAAMKGQVDGIILTAGLAYWTYLVDLLKERIGFLAPVYVYPGENEIESLAFGVLRVLNGEEQEMNYDQEAAKEDHLGL
ncbi:butyrate kinase [Ohessyouella blattaphilus]|uniref:Probable butyrate kinase n=1 Tax=Ohessyouella blattaphilus TaxID=2949333 RepID=A0ABT1EEP9_9FIRM|nr:butyrate kinase [Ohessyouella blattaphilus]MCP1108981.1 butyrate kinase [Ohessyouella blattaphilus]MCR8562375.1 butyrate kinase [Ohessyouella blattaphilus]